MTPEENVDIITTIVTGTLLFGLLSIFIIYFILLYRKSQTKLYLERERRKQELLRAEVEIKEQTLVNVSREIHDNLGQAAALVKINLNLVSKNISVEDQQKVDESIDLMKKLIGDMRSLSASLNGDTIRRKGIIAMLQQDVERVNKTGYVAVEFAHPSETITLEDDQLVILYRMIQELFTNTLKYAKASKIILRFEETKEHVMVYYTDDGIGFDFEEALHKGSGLTNIQDRCHLIGGKLNYHSRENEGVQVQVSLSKNGQL